jgi:hypothetical protein
MWFKAINLLWIFIFESIGEWTNTCSNIKNNIVFFYSKELFIYILLKDFFFYNSLNHSFSAALPQLNPAFEEL